MSTISASNRPPKIISKVVLREKSGFESIMVSTPKFDVFEFAFLKLPRAKGKMDIFGGHKKCPNLGGQNGYRWPSAINEKPEF